MVKMTMIEAGAAAILARPLQAPTPAPVPHLRLVTPGFVPEPPASVPTKLPGIVRWGGVWGLAMSIPGDSSPAPMRELHYLSEHTDGLQRQLDLLKKQRDDLQREVGQKWYWGADELTRIGQKIVTLDRKIYRLELVVEWIQLLSDQFNNDNALLGPDIFQKYKTQYRLEAIEAELARMDEHGNRRVPTKSSGIVASAGGGSDKKDSKTTEWEDVDWEKLTAANDNLAFARAEDIFVRRVRAEVVRRLDAGQETRDIYEWYQTKILPAAKRIIELTSALQKTADEKQVFHDLRNRLLDLILNVPVFLQTNQVEMVRASCQPTTGSLRNIVQHLQSRFALNASVLHVNMSGLRLAPHVDQDAFLAIVVNLVGNAADHPLPGKSVTRVKLELIQGMLVIDDKGAGMEEEALENLRTGVRIHDGVRVSDEDANNDHGFGWKIIRENADKLGIELEIDSEPGYGTTVTLVLPDGFIEPDPLEYALMGRVTEDQLRNITLEIPEGRRREIVVEMNQLSTRILNQHFIQLWDLPLDARSVTHFQDHVRQIGERYSALLKVVMEGLDPSDSAMRTAVWQAEMLRTFLQSRK